MSNTEPNQKELKRIHRLLRQMAEMVQHASLTGSLQQGGTQAVQQYNNIVVRLEQIGEIPTGFFPSLAADIPFDGVGIAAGSLAAYIQDTVEEEQDEKSQAGDNGEHRVDSPSFSVNIGGPVTLGDLESLRSLGDILRNSMPDWIKEKMADKAVEEQTVEVAAEPQAVASPSPAPPVPPTPPTVNRLTAISDAPHVAEFVPDSPARTRVS